MKKLIFFTMALAFVATAAPFHMWNDKVAERAGETFPTVSGAVHSRVFTADAANGGYNHHANIIFFYGKFHVNWSNHRYCEDGPGQRVLYKSSSDARKWGEVRELFPAPHPEAPREHSGIFATCLGFVTWEGRLFAVANTTRTVGWKNLDQTKSSSVFTSECNYPVYRAIAHIYREILPNGRFGPIFTDDPGKFPDDLLFPLVRTSDCVPGFREPDCGYDISDALRQNPGKRRFCEPVVWRAADGRFVLLLRDDSGSYRKWVSFSADGKNWSAPVISDIPDAPSWSCRLALESGTVLLFGNHHGKGYVDEQKRWRDRDPLLVSVSTDGIEFHGTRAVCSGWYKHQLGGIPGRGGSAQYPCAILRNGICHVAYSLGKESIAVTSFPVVELLKGL